MSVMQLAAQVTQLQGGLFHMTVSWTIVLNLDENTLTPTQASVPKNNCSYSLDARTPALQHDSSLSEAETAWWDHKTSLEDRVPTFGKWQSPPVS